MAMFLVLFIGRGSLPASKQAYGSICQNGQCYQDLFGVFLYNAIHQANCPQY